ncbi:alkyl sulfatase dimerization domain-containing protein [Marinobacter alexandrii]|uniref:alkyl sulfatase dimerization domain-containing protein n=1 Tax=Marinobacter alexandrii TaxID=2570351 RepID=UPI00110950C0|nr:alkyl sulfatase dimerization domain-containing protein [Marinobacter alexandrii]
MLNKNLTGILMGAALTAGLPTQSVASELTKNARYNDAADAPLATLNNGAKVGQDTLEYWQLPSDSPQRASYDELELIEVADKVWTVGSESIVNSHAIEGPEGLIVYDTGDNMKDARHFYEKFRSVSNAPIKAIIYSHEHYVYGARYFVEQEAKRGNTDIKIIGHPNTNESIAKGGVTAFHPEVSSTLLARSMEQFNLYLPDEGPDAAFKNTIIPGFDGFVPVNTTVEHGERMTVAGLDLVFYSKGIATDTNYQVLVHVPEKDLVMNNVVWGWFPNIYSVRGGNYRNPQHWEGAIEFIESLEPEILLSSHSTSLANPELIAQRLQNYKDGLSFVLDQTLKGILLGLEPDELSYFVQLPEHLKNAPVLVENYGEIATMPPRIFAAIFGSFDGDAAFLNKLHPDTEAQRMLSAMGGEQATYDKAKNAYNQGDYLWSCQLASYLVRAKATQQNRQLKADCLRAMGQRALSTNSRSWYLSQARDLEGKTHVADTTPAAPQAIAGSPGLYVDYYRVRINPNRSSDTEALLALKIGDQTFGLDIRRGVANYRSPEKMADASPDATLTMAPETWALLFNNLAAPATLAEQGKLSVAGDGLELLGLFDPIYDWQNDPSLKTVTEIFSKAND